VTLALFDLDNTLIAGDSDHAWGEFLVEKGVVDGPHYREANDRFYRDYQAGTLDILAYLAFALEPLRRLEPARLNQLQAEFMRDCIADLWLPAARALLAQHRQQGHRLVIITATNSFITRPIAQALGVDDLIATEPELSEGRYTGRVLGTPCFQAGKVTRLTAWLQTHQQSLAGSYFYSDSINDVPLLEAVDHPVAVDPDPRLRAWAQARQVPIMSLRATPENAA
jgi:HAD superfamily hydrolase (TIGR01490 family)